MASQSQITLVDYSKLSIVAFNVPKKYEEKFRQIGGLFNPKLGEKSGWLFHMKDKEKVNKLINEINSGKLIQSSENKEDTIQVSRKEFMNLLRRVELLESRFSSLTIEIPQIQENEESTPPDAKFVAGYLHLQMLKL